MKLIHFVSILLVLSLVLCYFLAFKVSGLTQVINYNEEKFQLLEAQNKMCIERRVLN